MIVDKKMLARFGLQLDGNGETKLTPEARIEALRRREVVKDQIMREMFRVLVDEEYVQYLYSQNFETCGDFEDIGRAGEVAANIAAAAAGDWFHQSALREREGALNEYRMELSREVRHAKRIFFEPKGLRSESEPPEETEA